MCGVLMAKQVAITAVTAGRRRDMNFSCSKQIFWTSYAYMYTGGVVTRALSIPLIVSVSYDCINPTT